jgi:ketosteroid isomerase-like protein
MDEQALFAANAAYYEAFHDRDLAAMGRVWAEDGISCIHPGWAALIGRAAVMGSWRGILANPDQPQVEFHGGRCMVDGDEGRIVGVEAVGPMTFAVTNQFRRIDGVWRMVHHQAGPIAEPTDGEPTPPPHRLH